MKGPVGKGPEAESCLACSRNRKKPLWPEQHGDRPEVGVVINRKIGGRSDKALKALKQPLSTSGERNHIILSRKLHSLRC